MEKLKNCEIQRNNNNAMRELQFAKILPPEGIGPPPIVDIRYVTGLLLYADSYRGVC